MIEVFGAKTSGSFITIVIHTDSKKEFAELIQRGSNLWPDASPTIKEFADKITNDGVVLQDYHNLSSDKAASQSKEMPGLNPMD